MPPLAEPGPMNDVERFVFETAGYLVIPDALTTEEAQACLEAAKRVYATLPQDRWCQIGNTFEQEPAFENLIDHPSLLPKARALFGDRFILSSSWCTMVPAGSPDAGWHQDGASDFRRPGLPTPLIQLRIGYVLTDLSRKGVGNLALIPGSHNTLRTQPSTAMTEDEIYLFDLNGYLVVEQVMTPQEVAQANAAIDRHADQIEYRSLADTLSRNSPALRGTHGRGELGGMLGWEKPWCEPFRRMLAHRRIADYLNVILGRGYRLDHGPSLLGADEGTEGQILHGESGPGFNPCEYYIVRDGKMHNGLTVVAWQLTDVNKGDGGFCVVPGSHKGNYPCPDSMVLCEKYRQFVKPIISRAGDVVIFTEALTHGALPWTGKHERRAILFKIAPACIAYSPGYKTWPTDPKLADMTDAERGVLEAPYRATDDRPSLDP